MVLKYILSVLITKLRQVHTIAYNTSVLKNESVPFSYLHIKLEQDMTTLIFLCMTIKGKLLFHSDTKSSFKSSKVFEI